MIKNLIFLLLSVLFAANCATVRSESKDYPYAEKDFIGYLDSFVEDSKGKVEKNDLYFLTMGFDDLEGTIAGVCYPNPFNLEVYIDKDWWEQNKGIIEREELIYHELAHCILYRLHVKPTEKEGFYYWLERLSFEIGIQNELNILPDGCPTSYMHPYTLSSRCINKHYDFYIDELFGRADIDKYREKIREGMRLKFWNEY